MQKKEQQRRARVATYEKGQARIEAILEAAAEVLISQGKTQELAATVAYIELHPGNSQAVAGVQGLVGRRVYGGNLNINFLVTGYIQI